MKLDRETAMRLWNKTFGKETSAHDFTGRKIVKGAYNDRNSEFSWNVDHILPQSKGGATNDSNLIVCHVLTNDEKADKFPCFTANKRKFEILKVQNHYEINELSKFNQTQKDSDLNFLDSASGVRLFKNLKGIQNKPRFVASVFIQLENIDNTAVIDFIEKLFDDENISFSVNRNYYSTTTTILLKNYDVPLKENISSILDKCVTLNTYLSSYFKKIEIISNYNIIFRVDYYNEKEEMYLSDEELNKKILNYNYSCHNSLFINNLVIENTEANKKVEFSNNEYSNYNMIYTQLDKNLRREASRR